MRPLMNMECYKWTLLRPIPLAQLCVSLALLSTSLARSLLLTRNTGAALGMHARRAQTLHCVHPQCI